MKRELKKIIRDRELRIEAYRFQGIAQPFPNHFHDYYVIGLMEGGERVLSCKNRDYTVRRGDILLFNPGDSHACVQSGCAVLDYRGLNISREVMLDLAGELTGRRELPGFSQTVLSDEEAVCCLRTLHQLVMEGSQSLEKEENLLLLLSRLFQLCGQPFVCCTPECGREVEELCAYMEEHFTQRISLDQLCRRAGLSKSALLRAFAKSKGVTPYRYLENIRIGRAKKLLEQGISPAEAALQTGFSDQSHFTNYFSRFIGLPPGVYREIFWEKEENGYGLAK